MKKRGFGMGKWNGTGGKVEENETVQEAAIRETEEEIGVTPIYLEHVATLTFNFAQEVEKLGKAEQTIVFVSSNWEGEPVETEEMKPKWFEKSGLPFENMWDDDPYWLPLVLNGEKIIGDFWFDRDFRMTKQKVKKVTTLPLLGE